MAVVAMNGSSLEALHCSFSIGGHYRNGMNLYGYLRSNPFSLDPLGLYDPFEAADEVRFDLTGGRAAAAHHLMG